MVARAKFRSQAGFTLLETLVAFAVLVLVVAVIFQVLANSSRSTRLAAEYAEAVVVAQSVLANAGIERDSPNSGLEGDYQWRLVRTEANYADPGASVALPQGLELNDYIVTVSWQKTGRIRTVSLTKTALSNAK